MAGCRSIIRARDVPAALLAVACLAACRAAPPDSTSAEGSGGAPREWLIDGASSGVDFTHSNGMSGRFAEPEIFGPGAALFDYDNDGDLDLYLVQGASADGGDRLYRNDLAAGNRPAAPRFVDVTADAGVDVRSRGIGVATGDFDNDGWTDLYLTRVGPNVLLRNNGNGTFSDVSTRSGTADGGWSSAATFTDVDRDGWLDLYVANYVDYDAAADVACETPAGQPDYCESSVYPGRSDRLYRNLRDGTFRDVTATALAGGSTGRSLAVASVDVDGDGWMDLFVSADRAENVLWMNRRDGTFVNAAPIAGVALSVDGSARSSRGISVGDIDNDGDEDLLVAGGSHDGAVLYENDGSGRFADAGTRSKVRPESIAYSTFGAGLFDIDNDSLLDVLLVNGAVTRLETIAATPFPYKQRKLLLRNASDGQFEDVTVRAFGVLGASEVSRGAAFGDVDNDGDADVVVANNQGPARLLLNAVGNRQHWLGLRLVARDGRSPLGAKVGIVRADGPTLWRRVHADGSYGSASDPRVLVGLGGSTSVAQVTVLWPGGPREAWPDVAIDRWTTLTQGTGR